MTDVEMSLPLKDDAICIQSFTKKADEIPDEKPEESPVVSSEKSDDQIEKDLIDPPQNGNGHDHTDAIEKESVLTENIPVTSEPSVEITETKVAEKVSSDVSEDNDVAKSKTEIIPELPLTKIDVITEEIEDKKDEVISEPTDSDEIMKDVIESNEVKVDEVVSIDVPVLDEKILLKEDEEGLFDVMEVTENSDLLSSETENIEVIEEKEIIKKDDEKSDVIENLPQIPVSDAVSEIIPEAVPETIPEATVEPISEKELSVDEQILTKETIEEPMLIVDDKIVENKEPTLTVDEKIEENDVQTEELKIETHISTVEEPELEVVAPIVVDLEDEKDSEPESELVIVEDVPMKEVEDIPIKEVEEVPIKNEIVLDVEPDPILSIPDEIETLVHEPKIELQYCKEPSAESFNNLPTEKVIISKSKENIKNSKKNESEKGHADISLNKSKVKVHDFSKEKITELEEDRNNKPEDLSTIDHRMNIDVPMVEISLKETNGLSKKRIRDEGRTESITPSKKLRKHLQHIFPKHNAALTNYIDNVCGNSNDELDKEINSVMNELENLRQMTHAKELEWNNLIHSKKVKEELLIRLLRKRKVLTMDNNKEEDIPIEETKTVYKDIMNDLRPEDEYISYDRNTPISTHQYNAMIPPIPTSCSSNSPLNMVTASQMDKQNYQYYGNKKIVPKPVGMMQGPRAPNIYDLNGLGYNMPMGRQGPIKDVQSIIADYRQRHPEVVPRRGRRMKSANMHNPQVAPGPRPPGPQDPSLADFAHLLPGMDPNHMNSPLDPLMAQQQLLLGQQPGGLPNGMSFKDVLVQFANMTGQGAMMGNPNVRLPPPPPYPEVTLHPVNPPHHTSGKGKQSHQQQQLQQQQQQQQQQQSNSLLHGILTKVGQNRQDSRFATFSPTLARLLTAPEKTQPAASISPLSATNFLSQNCGEITITPVNNVPNRQPQEIVQLDDFEETEPEDDSADRPLVIDEGNRNEPVPPSKESNNGNAVEVTESEVPECQGCKKREAQFVCAGCANQWYCSRECQVAAWDEHSEVCSG